MENKKMSKAKRKGFTSKGVERVSEVEPYSFFETEEYKKVCDKVYNFIRKCRNLTLGACSRAFQGKILSYPLLDVLETLRKQGMINFERKGLITHISLGGIEIKPAQAWRGYNRSQRID